MASRCVRRDGGGGAESAVLVGVKRRPPWRMLLLTIISHGWSVLCAVCCVLQRTVGKRCWCW